MASSISIGKIRYDIVSDTTKFNKGMKVTGAQIKQVDKAFRDHAKASSMTRYELERLQDTIQKNGGATASMAQQEQVLIARLKEEEALERRVADARRKAGMSASKSAREIAMEAKSVDMLEKELKDLEKQSKRTFNARGGAIGGTIGGSAMSVLGLGGVGGAAGRLAGTGIGGYSGSALLTGTAVAGLGGAAFGLKSVTEWAKLEAQIVDLTAIIGDESKANTLVGNLRALAKQTPLTTSTLIKGVKTLRSYGIEVKNETKLMRRFGDISGGNAEKMNSLILAYSQVQAAGKLMGQEMLQLINAGFPVAEIAKAAGVSMSDFRKEMEAGNITADHLTQAIENLTDAGGLFAGRMEAASKTLTGSWTRMWAEVSEAMSDLGKDIAEGGWISEAMVGFGKTVGGVIKSLGFLVEAFQRAYKEFAITMSLMSGHAYQDPTAATKQFAKSIREAVRQAKALGVEIEGIEHMEAVADSFESGIALGDMNNPQVVAGVKKQIEKINTLAGIGKGQSDRQKAGEKAASEAGLGEVTSEAEKKFKSMFEVLVEQASMVGLSEEEAKRMEIEMQRQKDLEEFGLTRANALESARLELLERQLAYQKKIEEGKKNEAAWEQEKKTILDQQIGSIKKKAAEEKKAAKEKAERDKKALRANKYFAGGQGGSKAGADYAFLAQRQQNSIQNKMDEERNKKLDKINTTLENQTKKIETNEQKQIKLIQIGE